MSSVPWLASPKSRRCTLVLISFVRDTQGMLRWSWSIFSRVSQMIDMSWDWLVMVNPKWLAKLWGFGGWKQFFWIRFSIQSAALKNMWHSPLFFAKQALRWFVRMRMLTPLWKGYTDWRNWRANSSRIRSQTALQQKVLDIWQFSGCGIADHQF